MASTSLVVGKTGVVSNAIMSDDQAQEQRIFPTETYSIGHWQRRVTTRIARS